MQIILAILALSFLIIIHELGHFIVAKLSDIKVHEFSLFMGPKLFSTQKGETSYSIRAIPLGGFVRMEGEEEASEDERAFNKKPLLTRVAVIAAGPIMNLITAIIMVVIIVSAVGYKTTRIDTVVPGSPAYEAKLQPGDAILKYDNKNVYHPADVFLFMFGSKGKPVDVEVKRGDTVETVRLEPEVFQKNRYLLGFVPKGVYGEGSNVVENADSQAASPGEGFMPGDEIIRLNDTPVSNGSDIRDFMNKNGDKPIKVTVKRDGTEKVLDITPTASNSQEQYDIGMDFMMEKGNFFSTVKNSVIYAGSVSRNVFYSFAWLITGRVSLSQLSGPVGIVSTIGDVVQQSPTMADKAINLLSLMAFIGINLGLFNLIPFPALDGSKLLLIAIEGIRKKAIPPEKEAFISLVGFVLLIMLMIFATYNDILRKVTGG